MSNSQFFQVSLRVRKLLQIIDKYRNLIQQKQNRQFEDSLAWDVNQNSLISVCTIDQGDLSYILSKDRKRMISMESFETQQFSYDSIETDPRTQQLYVKLCRPIVKQAISGFHVTVLCYGQTTSGKTYTMLGDQNNPGIIPCTIRDLFNWKSNQNIQLWVQYLQIYNEQLDDLLGQTNRPILIEDPKWGTTVSGADRIKVGSFEEAIGLMNLGEENRVYRATKIHEHSSRSHTVFKIYVQVSDEKRMTYACINLIDLAGSERLSDADQQCQNETGYINKSLFSLTNVINKLAEKQKHIPFRDSKLTRLLTDSLGGNSQTLLICCISPAKKNFFQTLSTLKFANQAKLIKNSRIQQIVYQTEDIRDEEIRNLKNELLKSNNERAQMKMEIERLQNQVKYLTEQQSLNQSSNLKQTFISSIDEEAETDKTIGHEQSLNNFKKMQRHPLNQIEQNSSNYIMGQYQQQQQPYQLTSKSNQNKSVVGIAVSSFQTPLNDKTVLVWGSNQDGRLGLGNTISISKSPKSLNIQFTSITCGSHHTIGITANGSIYSWGRNQHGQLGLGNNNNASKPSRVNWNQQILQVSCGWQHTIALDSNGSILTWGYGEDGQLGLGSLQTYNQPQIINGYEASQIWAGHSNTAFITNDDQLFCFGSNWDGRCMLEQLQTICSPQLALRDRIRSLSLGVSHMGVVLNSGQLIMAGIGTEGQLGTILDEKLPQTFKIERPNDDIANSDEKSGFITDIATTGLMVERFSNGGCAQVSCGDRYTIVLNENGSVYAFGKASYNRLGIKSQNNIYEPTILASLKDHQIRRIEAGFRHAGVIDVKGNLYMWGFNFHNQLGLGQNDQDQEEPIKIDAKGKVQQLSLGYFHTVVLVD